MSPKGHPACADEEWWAEALRNAAYATGRPVAAAVRARAGIGGHADADGETLAAVVADISVQGHIPAPGSVRLAPCS